MDKGKRIYEDIEKKKKKKPRVLSLYYHLANLSIRRQERTTKLSLLDVRIMCAWTAGTRIVKNPPDQTPESPDIVHKEMDGRFLFVLCPSAVLTIWGRGTLENKEILIQGVYKQVHISPPGENQPQSQHMKSE